MTRWLVLLLLFGCGPEAQKPPEPDHRGEAGHYCRPDGSCISPLLECVNSPLYLGIPVDANPSCRVKVKP